MKRILSKINIYMIHVHTYTLTHLSLKKDFLISDSNVYYNVSVS